MQSSHKQAQPAGTPGFSPHDSLSGICSELWDLDENRLRPGQDYAINLQGGTKSYRQVDKAKDPLFSWVKPEVFQRPTFKTFVALLDNYESETGVAEEVTPEEVRENWRFIDAIISTKVMKRAHQYLVSKGKSSSDEKQFKQQLYDLWFKLYRRTRESRVLDSSGFEHVFVGETRGGTDVLGFHNWIQFYLQEKAGNVDYQGYILGTKHEEGAHSHLITIQFKWNREVKPIGSTFIGTSPEFEVALYTVCFLCSESATTDLRIAEYEVVITCHRHGVDKLGTSYPKAFTGH